MIVPIIRQFNRAAHHYGVKADLQREVCDRLLTALPTAKLIGNVLDLGAGTAFARQALLSCYPNARYLALDNAWRMLQTSSYQQQDNSRVCADAHYLPFADDSISLCFSNLMLQWCDVDKIFSEIARVMLPGSKLLLTTFGPKTLQELKVCWRAIDDYEHVNTFLAMDTLQEHAARHFSSMNWQVECVKKYYPDLTSMMRALKGMGANHVLGKRLKGLLGRSRWQRLNELYENQFGSKRGLLATFEIYYLDGQL